MTTDSNVAADSAGEVRRRLRLEVPALIDRPYLTGSLCCAPAAADLVEAELRSWRLWVTAVNVDGERGRVELVVADDAPLKDMFEALEDLGYPVRTITAVTADANQETQREVADVAT